MANNELSNSGWRIGSGSWRIVTDTINGKTVKVIKCISAGVLYLPTSNFQQSPTEAAYGSFEFYIQHQETTNTQIVFIADTLGAKDATGQDGYYFDISSSEVVALGESVNGIATDKVTNAGGIVSGEWTKFKITRDASGLFTLYKNGSQLGSTFTDTTTTTSSYICLSFGVNDMLSLGAVDNSYAFTKRILS